MVYIYTWVSGKSAEATKQKVSCVNCGREYEWKKGNDTECATQVSQDDDDANDDDDDDVSWLGQSRLPGAKSVYVVGLKRSNCRGKPL